MNVSYSMVGRLYSEVSSTALRQHGGCQNKLTHKDQPPFIRKVRSGAVNNASQLKKPLNLNLNIWFIKNIPKKPILLLQFPSFLLPFHLHNSVKCTVS